MNSSQILIVDDEAQIRKLLQITLQSNDYQDVSLSEEKGFGLDTSNVTMEKFPLIVSPVTSIKLKRIE